MAVPVAEIGVHTETNPLFKPLLFSTSPEQPSPQDIQSQIINHVAEAIGTPVNSEDFRSQALKTWFSWHYPRGTHDPYPESPSSWSHLVPSEFTPSLEAIDTAHQSWTLIQDQGHIPPYVATIGVMGSGKSELAKALHDSCPHPTTLHEEEYQRITLLPNFYAALKQFVDADQPSLELTAQLHHLQAEVQSGFAAYKFLQMLQTASELTEQPIVQDVYWPADASYVTMHEQLGIASPENVASYHQDTLLRQRLLPPHVRHPIIIYPLLPFDVLEHRVRSVRGRDFEAGVPQDYLLYHYILNAQLALALAELTYPVIVIDTHNHDFRPENGGAQLAANLWPLIETIHHQEVLPRLGLNGAAA